MENSNNCKSIICYTFANTFTRLNGLMRNGAKLLNVHEIQAWKLLISLITNLCIDEQQVVV